MWQIDAVILESQARSATCDGFFALIGVGAGLGREQCADAEGGNNCGRSKLKC
jgi:hypothetical protein